jgi:tetratricopeptide (TPR) repeat protein
LKGRHFFNKRSGDGFEKSIKYFKLAIEIDPDYALAYAGLAASYNLLAIYTLCPPREALRKAKAAALQALKIDSGLAEAHTIIGHIKMRSEWDWSGAEEELQRAIALNGGCASAHQIYSIYLRTTGRLEESMIEIRRAQELDPLSLSINASLATAHYLARRHDEAIEQLKSTIEMDENFPMAHYLLGLIYDQQGKSDQAIAQHERAMKLMGDPVECRAAIGYTLARSGRSTEARKVLKWLAETARHRHVSPYQSALIHTALGNVDDAFIFLERGFEEQDEDLSLLKMDPMLDGLRADRRFGILLQRIGLPP